MNLERTIQALCDGHIDFVLIGGVAATLHGSSQVTFDLDLCYSRSKTNLTLLKEALAPFHPRPRGFAAELPFVWDEATLPNNSVVTLHTDLGDIDLLAEVPGLGAYEQVKRCSRNVRAFGHEVAVIDLPSLIHAKRACGRPKDLSALPELESLLEANDKR